MEFRQLKYFLAVADNGGFSQAAKALRISQPTLSIQVKLLEELVGDRLFTRTKTGAELTELGKTFAVYARSALREAQKAIDEVRLIRGLERGRVSFGLSSVFNTFIGPEVVESFGKKYPNIRLDVSVSTHTPGEIAHRLLTGEWDFAFVLDRGAYPTGIAAQQLLRFDSGVYAAADHPLVRKRKLELKDFARFDWIVSPLNSTDGFLDRAFRPHGLPTPQLRVVTNSFNFIRELVRRSHMLCMLPHAFVRREVRNGELKLIRQDHFIVRATAGLITASERVLTPSAAAAIAAFRAACVTADAA
jgi:LysR family cyn operon transcriptional activator